MFGPWLNGFRPKLKSRILVGATAICWTIWLNRNDMVFEGGKSNTPSVSNFKTFQQSWRVKAISSLTKIIERNIKIYDIKLMYYKNITNKDSNGT